MRELHLIDIDFEWKWDWFVSSAFSIHHDKTDCASKIQVEIFVKKFVQLLVRTIFVSELSALLIIFIGISPYRNTYKAQKTNLRHDQFSRAEIFDRFWWRHILSRFLLSNIVRQCEVPMPDVSLCLMCRYACA